MTAIPLRRLEGKYEILEKVREGGMGAIYKVRHRLLDEIRVVKLMRPQLVENAELRARFLREAQVAIKLRHPNIAQLYDFTTDKDGTSVIVMEFISGKTLEEILRSTGPPALGLTLELARQSLRALAYLHGKGFIHRDISPDNLMLTEDPDGRPQIKMIDLGIAKILGGQDTPLTRSGTFLGKVRYAAPEQFGVEVGAVADARSDIYSFGVVLYELLTGVNPITGTDASSILAGHLFHPPLPFDESDPQGIVPSGLRAVVLKALAKKPDERYPSAHELAAEVARVRVGLDLSTQDRLDDYVLDRTPAPAKPSAADERALVADPAGTVPIGSGTSAPPGKSSFPGALRRSVSLRSAILGGVLAVAQRVRGKFRRADVDE